MPIRIGDMLLFRNVIAASRISAQPPRFLHVQLRSRSTSAPTSASRARMTRSRRTWCMQKTLYAPAHRISGANEADVKCILRINVAGTTSIQTSDGDIDGRRKKSLRGTRIQLIVRIPPTFDIRAVLGWQQKLVCRVKCSLVERSRSNLVGPVSHPLAFSHINAHHTGEHFRIECRATAIYLMTCPYVPAA
jgi:hypothetical protein